MVIKKRSLGIGFADEVSKVTLKSSQFKRGEGGNWTDTLIPNFQKFFEKEKPQSLWLIAFFSAICLVATFLIFLRLFHLQIVAGSTNRELADGNRIQIKIIHAPRGVIYDRDGTVLAANSPAFRLVDPKTQKVRLISREEALAMEVKNDPVVADLEIDNVRTYPLGKNLAHVVGFVGEISEEQIKSEQFKSYKLGDMIGQLGVEAQYEEILRGKDGGEIIEVDSQGQRVRTLRRNAPIPGKDIYLTIEGDLQTKIAAIAKETLKKVSSCCGAIVVMDPQNGGVLALLSFPSFDPNLITQKQDEAAIQQIFADTTSPMLNRAIGGTYPPGSTFKIVSSLAALASGKISPQTTFQDNGVVYIDIFKFTNWYFNQYGRTEGPVNLVKAIKRSNDTYFYEAAKILGEGPLIDWSRKLLLGSKLGIDLPGEEQGLVPDDQWKRKTFNEVWFPGDTLHMAIGQGFVLTTPLQILGVTSYIAADGVLYQPQLLSKVAEGDKIVSEFSSKLLLSNLANQDHIKIIKQGLVEAASSGGTAWPMFIFPIETAGKTGTAEYGDPKNRTHAWYTGYAPSVDPKIVMTVLIEGGGEGSSVAAPIVKETFRWYLSEDKNKLIKDIYNVATESARTLGE
ncbi:penicillin-binding protein 2 [Candidatus Daviesbacteria bacterium]|nr:penicillin-binding protein 2 [Candidatus Daviesbacteria bacterium]MBI4035438.1 penicillin-binding protein 2 [Candidatus Daviesbacteria bacterium]